MQVYCFAQLKAWWTLRKNVNSHPVTCDCITVSYNKTANINVKKLQFSHVLTGTRIDWPIKNSKNDKKVILFSSTWLNTWLNCSFFYINNSDSHDNVIIARVELVHVVNIEHYSTCMCCVVLWLTGKGSALWSSWCPHSFLAWWKHNPGSAIVIIY